MKVKCNNVDCDMNCFHKKPHEPLAINMKDYKFLCTNEENGCRGSFNNNIDKSWCICCELDSEMITELNRILDI